MTHHITADLLVESATHAVTEELFRDFDESLRRCLSTKTSCMQTTLDRSCCRTGRVD